MKAIIKEVRPKARSVSNKRTRNPGYEPGNNWVDCDICGFTIRAKDARITWDNKVVCPSDWEPRHPQDFVRSRVDKITPDLLRPEPPFIPDTTCPPCIVDLAIVGCSLIGSSTSTGGRG